MKPKQGFSEQAGNIHWTGMEGEIVMTVMMRLDMAGKEAKLVLLNDNITVQIIYDGEVIASSAGNTWNNFKDEEWAQKAFIQFQVEDFLRKNRIDGEFEEARKLLD